MFNWLIYTLRKKIIMREIITLKQYNEICKQVIGVRGQLIVDAHNKILPLYNMDTVDIMEEFIPNLLVECQCFYKFEENMNYSVMGLIRTFGRHRISTAQCYAYGRIDGKRAANKVAIANTVYGGAFGKSNLGNTQPNDGWDFRGSGAIQGTGRKIMEDFSKYHNYKFGTDYTALEVARKLRDLAQIEMNLHFACWFFSIIKGLIPYAISDDFKTIVKRINGGYNGMDERTEYYNKAKKVLRK